MTASMLAYAVSFGTLAAGCTYHAAIGGMGAAQTDGMTSTEKVPKGSLALLAGAGPCLRWPRLRTSITLDGAIRGASASVLAASETFWIVDEGHARGLDITNRTSLALKTRIAGGQNFITDRWIAEMGLGLAIAMDSEQIRDVFLAGKDKFTGDFHAVSIDVIATYAPDRQGEDEVWIGAQLAFQLNGLSFPTPGGTRIGGREYTKPRTDESTDCNSGHLP